MSIQTTYRVAGNPNAYGNLTLQPVTPRLEEVWDKNIELSQQLLETNKQLALQKNWIDELKEEIHNEIWKYNKKLCIQVFENQKDIKRLQDDIAHLRNKSNLYHDWLIELDEKFRDFQKLENKKQ